jgi:hypothetical protein
MKSTIAISRAIEVAIKFTSDVARLLKGETPHLNPLPGNGERWDSCAREQKGTAASSRPRLCESSVRSRQARCSPFRLSLCERERIKVRDRFPTRSFNANQIACRTLSSSSRT